MVKALKGQEAFEARVTELTENIIEELDLGWLTVVQMFNEHDNPGSDILAEAYPYWEYRQTKIIWHVATAITKSDEDLEHVIIHELVHALIAPLFEELSIAQQHKLTKHNELATENVARAITAVRQR